MKVPALGPGEPTIGIDSFEIEQMILPTLTGPSVPRFVAAGDLTATPYIVMEWIDGQGLEQIIARAPLPPDEVARIGAALADAVHSVHTQEVIHLDLKPENVMLRPTGEAVLLDFGFARHARYPDLLAESKDFAAGSAAYVSPEQLQNDRSDARSDLFALGRAALRAGHRHAAVRRAADLRRHARSALARARSAACAERARAALAAGDHPALPGTDGGGALPIGGAHRVRLAPSGAGRAVGARGSHRRRRVFPAVRPLVARRVATSTCSAGGNAIAAARAPVIMVAVDTEHPDDERHPSLQLATRQLVALNPEFRLMCVSVIRAAPLGEGPADIDTASGKHLEHKTRLRHWVEPLKLPSSRVSLHVVERPTRPPRCSTSRAPITSI